MAAQGKDKSKPGEKSNTPASRKKKDAGPKNDETGAQHHGGQAIGRATGMGAHMTGSTRPQKSDKAAVKKSATKKSAAKKSATKASASKGAATSGEKKPAAQKPAAQKPAATKGKAAAQKGTAKGVAGAASASKGAAKKGSKKSTATSSKEKSAVVKVAEVVGRGAAVITNALDALTGSRKRR